MTLNEREAFEALPDIKEKLNTVYFDESLNSYFAAMINSGPTVKYVQGAWMAWQAKAQAVPNTQVLIPKELPDELNDQIWDEYLTPLVFNGCDEIGYICCDDLDLEKLYQLIVKASESGAEG